MNNALATLVPDTVPGFASLRNELSRYAAQPYVTPDTLAFSEEVPLSERVGAEVYTLARVYSYRHNECGRALASFVWDGKAWSLGAD